MKNGEHADENEEPTDEERALTKKYADDLLGRSEANAPKVYVLELMKVLPGISRLRNRSSSVMNAEYRFSMLPIIELVERLGLKTYRSPVSIDRGVLRRSVATVAEKGELESLGLCGESLWLREVENDELFEAKDRWLLLQARQIREIESDFILGALKDHLALNANDARLAVLHSAGELLMEHLSEDLWLVPDRFSDVVTAIDEVLSRQEWFDFTEDKIRNLASQVVQRVDVS